jgi:hypothetical protein
MGHADRKALWQHHVGREGGGGQHGGQQVRQADAAEGGAGLFLRRILRRWLLIGGRWASGVPLLGPGEMRFHVRFL